MKNKSSKQQVQSAQTNSNKQQKSQTKSSKHSTTKSINNSNGHPLYSTTSSIHMSSHQNSLLQSSNSLAASAMSQSIYTPTPVSSTRGNKNNNVASHFEHQQQGLVGLTTYSQDNITSPRSSISSGHSCSPNHSSSTSSTHKESNSSTPLTHSSKSNKKSLRQQDSSAHNSHRSSNSSSHRNKSSHVNSTSEPKQPFRTVLCSLAVACFVAVALISANPKLLSSISNNSFVSNNRARYIRSVSNQDSNTNSDQNNKGMQHNTFINKISNGVTEMISSKVPPAIKNLIPGLLSSDGSNTNSNNMRAADLSNLSKNGKLHYIPSSAFDPTKTAHHVLEGAGYRLNIPSYVQSIPASEQKGAMLETSDSDSQKDTSTESDNSHGSIKNDDFDLALQQKQVIRPRAPAYPKISTSNFGSSGTFGSSQNNNNYQPNIATSFNNQNEVPLSKVDPDLDELVKEMLEQQKSKSSVVSPGFPGSTSGQFSGNPGLTQGLQFDLVKKPNTTEIFNKNSELGMCTPQKDIVFAKTHKTGGTTITNMLLRHAEKQKLNVALPVEYHWELAGYPANYNADLITPKQENYNVMCHHMRFNKTEIEKQVNPLADYFTILRDPVSNFESSFGFFKDYPFTNWLDNSRSIDDFVNHADQYYNKSTPWYFRAKNYMSFDLGFDHENNTDAYVRHAISKMEDDFKFVMITDRYEESMILLKNMLCLDYDDIVYLPLKVRTEDDRKKISADTAAKIKKWNRLDTAIYEYFSARFEQMTVDYGKDKLAREVEILKEKLKDVEARCVEDYDSQSLKPWIKRIKLRKPSGQMCQRLVWGEVKYADYLRQLQYSKLSEEEYASQPSLDDKIQLMQTVQQQVLGQTAGM